MQILSENDFENFLIDILVEEMGYEYKKGADLREEYSSMNDYHSVVIKEIFEYYLKKINKNADNEAIEETVKKIINLESLDFIEKNRTFLRYADITDKAMRNSNLNDTYWLVPHHFRDEIFAGVSFPIWDRR